MKAETREFEKRSAASRHMRPAGISEPEMTGQLEKLPRDVGWMLFGVGFAGFVAPGIFGLPFMVAGGMILWPKTTSRLQAMFNNRPSKGNGAPGMKQVVRFLDDLERRYPSGEQSYKWRLPDR